MLRLPKFRLRPGEPRRGRAWRAQTTRPRRQDWSRRRTRRIGETASPRGKASWRTRPTAETNISANDVRPRSRGEDPSAVWGAMEGKGFGRREKRTRLPATARTAEITARSSRRRHRSRRSRRRRRRRPRNPPRIRRPQRIRRLPRTRSPPRRLQGSSASPSTRRRAVSRAVLRHERKNHHPPTHPAPSRRRRTPVRPRPRPRPAWKRRVSHARLETRASH